MKTLPILKFATLDNGRTRCMRCDKSFGQKQTALRHYNEKHVALDQVFECDLCQKKFKLKRRLSDHLLKRHKITHKMIKSSTD